MTHHTLASYAASSQPAERVGRFRDLTFRSSAGVIKRLERIFSTDARLFRWYGGLFYGRVLERELRLIALAPGERVLHIGAGALPYTACFLAARGHEVDAVDSDPRTLARARAMVQACGVAGRVWLLEQDGLRVAARGYAAIWVSLHVSPKGAILERLLHAASPGCWIVYREPRSWLRLFYHCSPLASPDVELQQATCAHRLGKQSVALRVVS